MKREVDKTPATEASVWEGFRETERLINESYTKFKQEMEASRAESERLRKESDAKFQQEMEQSRAEFDRRKAESDAAFEKSRVDFDKRMKKLDERIGGMSNSDGLFAEEYFFNSFEDGQQTFFGEKFDDIVRSAKGINKGFKDEYDIVMLNGKSVGIVEVKYRARLDDIPKIVNKANTFRGNFPNYQNHQIYLALATLIFNERLEDECIKQGIAIVKQVGDSVVMNYDHLKIF